MTTLASHDNSVAAGVDARFVEQARKLAPLVEAEAAAGEKLGTMPPAVVEALRESGLFNLMVPSVLGGSEVNAVTAISVFEELTAADASIGWSHMANASSSAFVAYLSDEAVSAMFAGEPAIIAGQFSPKGPAIAVDGGFQVSGNYSFGSGSGHANWMGGGAIEMDNGAPRFVDGRPIIRAYFVPKNEVEFLGNWDVMGLVGTGSYDYAVSERVVPEAFTFVLTDPQVRRGGSLYQLGVMGMTSAGHAGFALGVSRRAVDEVLALSARKQRMGHPTPVSGIERFQYELGRHTAMLNAARAFVFDAFSSAQSSLVPGEMISAAALATLRQATTHVTHVSAAVVDFAYHWSGADGIRPGVLQRLWRDAHTSTQHIFVDDSTFTEAG
ncbi:MAG: acyl-CoA dehydrogenase, partial [Mycobacterium sp.]|nr:acyl-CoA dehydrogenase [Mycobacterium sp.]